MGWSNRFAQHYLNAQKAVEQIRNGEWVPQYNKYSKDHITAKRGNLTLWLGNGAWFCEISDGDKKYLGLFWRHYVWWAAARKLKRDADYGVLAPEL